MWRFLALAQSNGSVAGMNGQRLAAAIHLAVDLRIAERALYRHRNAQADVPISGAGINIGLKIRWQHEVHAPVTRANRPTGNHLRAGQDARVHATVSGLHVQRVKPACNTDMAVAGVGVHFPVKVARLDAPVAGAQANVALQAVHRDAAVIRMQIDTSGQGICFHGTIPGVDIYISTDGIRLNRAVAGLNLQIRLARHPDFNVQSPGILAPIPVPMAGNASGQFHSVAVLAGVYGEVLAQLEAMVLNAEFDLFGVAGGDANAAVIRVHLYVGSTSHGVGLDDLFGPDS